MNILNTLKTNWRDIIAGVGITLAAALIADIVTNLSIKQDGMVWLATVADVLKCASRFFAANMIAFLGIAVAWPSLNRFSNDSFSSAWKNTFSAKDKLIAMIAVACVYVIAASNCIG